MADEGKAQEGPWAILSAIGGLIGGIASVLGVMAARPDLITVVVPVQTLERVVERAQAAQAGAAPASEQVAAAPAVVQPVVAAPPPIAAPTQSLGGNLSAALVSLGENPDAFIANLRFTNDGDTPVFIGVRVVDPAHGDVNISDAMGGQCLWRSDVSGATIRAYPSSLRPDYQEYMKPIGAHQSAVATVVLSKQYCPQAPLSGQPVTLSATLVVAENDQARLASASFENITPARAN